MSAPRKEKEKYRGILSEAGNVVSQLNICIDIKYQLYILRSLHNTPHAAEDNGERERCCRILKQLGCKITEMRDYDKNGVQEIPGEAANYTSESAILQEQVSTAFSPQCMENLAKYILGNGSGNKNRDVGDDSKRICASNIVTVGKHFFFLEFFTVLPHMTLHHTYKRYWIGPNRSLECRE